MIRRWSHIKFTNDLADLFLQNHRTNIALRLQHKLLRSNAKFKKFNKYMYNTRTKFFRKARARAMHKRDWLLYTTIMRYWPIKHKYARNTIKFQYNFLLLAHVSAAHHEILLRSKIRHLTLTFPTQITCISFVPRVSTQKIKYLQNLPNLGFSFKTELPDAGENAVMFSENTANTPAMRLLNPVDWLYGQPLQNAVLPAINFEYLFTIRIYAQCAQLQSAIRLVYLMVLFC